jgi:hypothetical protein
MRPKVSNTTGIVAVAAFAATAEGVPPAAITVTRRLTNSAASTSFKRDRLQAALGKLRERLKGEPVETSRTKDGLRCRITVVTNRAEEKKRIRQFMNDDGHTLVGWQPRKRQ